ncbi:MAG TPA: glycosyltransferase family A protein [Pyrinomonadaceae bacterium]|jgi:glycosyltransferase involved in cell wall biosynthesis|nr:glycosyltransferase family A protein [Pyrinomonadaceae bacterium]
MPKVSVIIPTHSRPHLLPRAVESARNAGSCVEVIVVDDASRDQTMEVCRQLEGIKYVRLEHNQGVAGARNIGILASSADYISFLDDDDVRLAGSLDLQVAALVNNKEAGLVCGAMLLADQEGNLTGEVSAPKGSGGDVFWEMLELDFPAMPISVVIRKECFTRVGLLDDGLPGIDDWDILVRIAEMYPVVIVDEPVSVYRKPTPFSGQGSSAQARHLLRAARHQLQLLQLPRAKAAPARKLREARRRAVNRIADTLLWNAAHAFRKGAYPFVCGNVLAALRLNPLRALRPAGFRKLVLMLRTPGG